MGPHPRGLPHLTTVVRVLTGTHSHICEDGLGVLTDLLVDIAPDRQVETEECVEYKENQTEVKEDLDVVGGDDRKFTVGRDPVGRGRLGSAAPRLVGGVRVGVAEGVFSARVGVVALFLFVFFILEYSDSRRVEVTGGELRLSSSSDFSCRGVVKDSAP